MCNNPSLYVLELYYVIYVLGSDSAKKYCPTHSLTNVGKRPDPDNFEFSENFFSQS